MLRRKENTFFYLLTLFLLSCLISLRAQSAIEESTNLKFRNYSVKGGLSQGTITAICQDKDGFLWFGTQDGLNRFDGYSFKIYRQNENGSFLSNSNIKDIIVDRDKNLWMSTNDGLNKYTPELDKFDVYRYKPFTTYDIVCEFDKDNLLISSKSHLLIFSKKKSRFKYLTELKCEIRSILVLDKKVLIGTMNGLIQGEFLDGQINLKEVKGLEHYFINKIIQLNNNLCLIGTNWGVVEYYLNGEIVFPKIKNNINDIFIDSKGKIWVSVVDIGLGIYNKEFQNVKLLSGYENFSRYFTKIFEDKSGALWFGSGDLGILKFEPNKDFFQFKLKINKEQKLITRVFALAEDLNGNIWIGTYGNGIIKVDKDGNLLTTYKNIPGKNSISGNDITCFAIDKNNKNKIWVGTRNNGVNIINMDTGIIEYVNRETNKGIPSNNIFAFVFDFDNNLWIATDEGLVAYEYSSGKVIAYRSKKNDKNSLSGNYCRALTIDKSGNVWVATWGNGVSKFLRDKKYFIQYFNNQKNEKKKLSFVNSIYIDNSDNHWLSTAGGGLVGFKPQNGDYRVYTTEDGLSNQFLYNFIEEPSGSLWIITNFGLTRFNPKSETFKNFYQEDGLQNDEFNDGAALKTRDGKYIVGGTGLNYFYIDKIISKNYDPPLVITSISVLDKERNFEKNINNLEEIRLKSNEGFITIEFSSLNYLHNERNNYSYKLEGLHDGWINLGNKRSITFTALEPNEYTLYIKGSNNEGNWSKNVKQIRIIIVPSFWQSIYSKILIAVILILLGFIFYRYRVSLLHIQQEKLKQIVDERTEELDKANAVLKSEIEERKKMEEELAQYIEELQESKDMMERSAFDLVEITLKIEESEKKLKEINAQKDKFFSIISHDLKSPFVALLGYTEIMVEDFEELSKEELKDFIGTIHKSSKNVYNLLENLLEWSRIQTGRIEYLPDYFNVYETAQNVIELLCESAKKKSIKLINEVEESAIVFADENMVNTIVRNLISNSLKFTNENGNIKISSRRDKLMIIIGIQDDGIGMSENDRSKLFRIDVHHTTIGTHKEKGTGVGLILCKELVEKNGGAIWVESEKGIGSTFYFSLPVRPVGNEEN